MRRIEQIAPDNWQKMQACLPTDYSKNAILQATQQTMLHYRLLSKALADEGFQEDMAAEAACRRYLNYIKTKLKCN